MKFLAATPKTLSRRDLIAISAQKMMFRKKLEKADSIKVIIADNITEITAKELSAEEKDLCGII